MTSKTCKTAHTAQTAHTAYIVHTAHTAHNAYPNLRFEKVWVQLKLLVGVLLVGPKLVRFGPNTLSKINLSLLSGSPWKPCCTQLKLKLILLNWYF